MLGNVSLQAPGKVGVDRAQGIVGQAPACPAVGAGVGGGFSLGGQLELPPCQNFEQGVPARRVPAENLGQKGPEGEDWGKNAIPACGGHLLAGQQSLGNQVAEGLLQFAQA